MTFVFSPASFPFLAHAQNVELGGILHQISAVQAHRSLDLGDGNGTGVLAGLRELGTQHAGIAVDMLQKADGQGRSAGLVANVCQEQMFRSVTRAQEGIVGSRKNIVFGQAKEEDTEMTRKLGGCHAIAQAVRGRGREE